MLTSNDLPALIAALQSRQPRAGWREGEPTSTSRAAIIMPSAAVYLPRPEFVDFYLGTFGSVVTVYVCGERRQGTAGSGAPPEDHADDICQIIHSTLTARTARLEREAADLDCLRELTEPDPLEGVTAESVSRLVAAIAPPDAAEAKWRAVPLVGVSAAALLIHHGNPHKVAYALKVATGLPVSSGPEVLEIKGTYAQALRAGEALSALSSIAESMIRCREDATP